MNAADHVLDPARIALAPNAIALITDGRSVSYAALLDLTNRIGNALLSLGIAPEQRVALMMNDSTELVAAYLAAIKIGAVAVALNIRMSPRELGFVLDDSRARVLIIDEEFTPISDRNAQLQAGSQWQGPCQVLVARRSPGSAPGPVESFESLVARQSATLPARSMSPDDMAFWIYTSGTTGTPKAAVHVHHDVAHAYEYTGRVLGVRPGDRLFATSKLFFAYSLGNCVFGSLALGATTLLRSGWPEPQAIAEVIDRDQPSVLFSVPTVYRNLLREGIVTPERFAGIRHCVSAGERLPVPIYERFHELSGGRYILDGIGTSETIFMFLSAPPDAPRAGSAGRPVPGVQVRLRDSDGARVRQPGIPGVLWVAMPSTADRYWNRQAQSQASFVGEWFRTGDVFMTDAEGYWYHLGRDDDMLKISGQWVSPGEIEDAVLLEDGVVDAAVVGEANDDGLTRLVLFLVTAADFDRIEPLKQRLLETLSRYKCPRDIRLVSEIPRTATGKAQRYRLRAAASSAAVRDTTQSPVAGASS